MSSSPFLSTSQQASPSFLLTPQQHQHPQHQQQQHVHLLTKDKVPVTYHTKWADLHPDSQNFILQVEARILEYRDESRRLDECDRLFDFLALNEGFEVDATRISQELGGISTAMERDKVLLQELLKTAKDLMRNAEVAVRSFVLLRSRFSRAVGTGLTSSNLSTNSTFAPSVGSGAQGFTQAVSPTLPVLEFYSGVPIKPSAFLLHTASRFEHQLQEYRQWVEELERLLFADNDENAMDSTHHSVLQSLPLVLTNIHDFFIHVAAKVETLHQHIWSRRTIYLANQRKKGDDNNPFLEADRREVAKREAASKRVHPTLLASMASQLSTQLGGLISNPTSWSTPSSGSSSSASMLFSGSSSFPAFNTAGGLTSTNVSAFSSPSSSLFVSSSAPSASICGALGTSTSASLFGSGISSSIFGSGPAAATAPSALPAFSGVSASSSSGNLVGGTPMPSSGLFGASAVTLGLQTPGSAFGNPAQPLGTAAPAFGIGTTQGTTTTKAKSRTTRRK
ncbi:hypothetical protein GOP47_0016229 [Adiantum capillus-veneris]|uniref:Uncharacterized protein n=1 Tax=Adiantum capillus-veneris TaxID=13818 RepID=A0A9D4ZAK0_ADICA|nr:hypothetical protein GOP47_0016229 [Adiantum capillus-veneris]